MSLKIGLKGETVISVEEHLTAKKMGSGTLRVLATPALVALVEKAAVLAVEKDLGQGETTVGMDIKLKHKAPTPVGMKVAARAELIEVQGKKLKFRVEAEDEKEVIGRGEHHRFIVTEEQFQRETESK